MPAGRPQGGRGAPVSAPPGAPRPYVALPVRSDYRRAHRILILLIAAHVVVMTLFPWIARFPGAVWDDMLEAWAWGQHFQLGYYKHPPFYAWIAGVWLRLFPRTDFSFYLLSALNIGIALAGVWRLSGLVLKKYARFPAISLLLFAPSHHYLATNFNANTILLSLWPWAAFFFIRSLQTRAWQDGLLFGVIGGCALLGKYSSILLLISCFVSALLHPDRRSYFRSPAPYCAVAACAIVFAPHALWEWQNGLTAVTYVLEKSGRPWWLNSYKALSTGAAGIAANAASTLVLLVALGRRWPALIPRLRRSWMARPNLWLTALALGPLVLTLLLGMVGYVKISPNHLIPTVYMLPLIVCRALGATLSVARVQVISRWAAGFMLLALFVVAPLIAYASVAFHFEDRLQLAPWVARVGTDVWHQRFSAPLRIATGTEAFSLALPFYSPDHPVEFSHYSFVEAPWITRERIARDGILFAYEAHDGRCREAANEYATAETEELQLTLQNTFWGLRGSQVAVVLIMTPPRVRRPPP